MYSGDRIWTPAGRRTPFRVTRKSLMISEEMD
jgi:hypothetical protein